MQTETIDAIAVKSYDIYGAKTTRGEISIR